MKNSTLLQEIVKGYHGILKTQRDPRVDGWTMMSSPFPTLMICLGYVYFVKIWGPNYMKNRKPFDLKKWIVLYNGVQVFVSAWLFYQFGKGGWFGAYNWKCQPVDYSLNQQAMTMLYACWWFYLSKFSEFLDTVFFVLRKKNEHVTVLHVMHHGCMPMTIWFGVKFVPGGHGTLVGLINPLVHSFMYLYYMLAALGPEYQKFIWWKRYLTHLQMIQFCITFVHAMQLLFIECNYPKAFVWWVAYHSVLFLSLFMNFYRKDEMKRQQKKLAMQKLENHQNGQNNVSVEKSEKMMQVIDSSYYGLSKRGQIKGH